MQFLCMNLGIWEEQGMLFQRKCSQIPSSNTFVFPLTSLQSLHSVYMMSIVHFFYFHLDYLAILEGSLKFFKNSNDFNNTVKCSLTLAKVFHLFRQQIYQLFIYHTHNIKLIVLQVLASISASLLVAIKIGITNKIN